MTENSFKIIPTLGRKTDVSPDDPSMFEYVAKGVYKTHDCGGVNFSLTRKHNVCMKSNGYVAFHNTLCSAEGRCLGLFELYDGTNRDYIHANQGHIYAYDGSKDPVLITSTDFASDAIDIYSMTRAGSYIVIADRAEHEPVTWSNGTTICNLQDTSTYKFRYLVYFARRIIGAYSDQTNGNIDIRWTAALPGIADPPDGGGDFAAANQLYTPNDDSITGMKLMGTDSCFVYCENSINQLVYRADYTSPFAIYTVVQDQGCTGHDSIVNYNSAHYLFNKNLGFCYYPGGNILYPISNDIEDLIQGIDTDYYPYIVGRALPMTRQIVWSVPEGGSTTNNALWFYNVETKQWTREDKAMRYIDSWNLYSTFSWNDLIAVAGGTGSTWQPVSTDSWAEYFSAHTRLVYSNTDGGLYYQTGDSLPSGNLNGYRIEPIMDFGNRERLDTLQEIWFDLAESGNFEIDVYHRSGKTAGEVIGAEWTFLGSVSHYSPEFPCLRDFSVTNKLHQIKWGTDLNNERFAVNGITFKFIPQGKY